LTLVAAENPTVQRGFFALALTLDCGARNTSRSVDMSLFYSAVRARLDASATLAATHRFERFAIAVALLVYDDLAEQDKRAELGRYKQRLTTNPTESRLDGITLFEDGRTIDKTACRKGWTMLFQALAQLEQHLLDSEVVVGGAGVGGNFRFMPLGIPLADTVFVGYSAHDYALCSIDQHRGVASTVDVPFQIFERRGVSALNPPFEKFSIFLKISALGNSAQVKPYLLGKVCNLFKK
jgi:hypothetical protein